MPRLPLEREVTEQPDRRLVEPHVITDPDELQAVVEYYLGLDEFVFDTETTAPPPYNGLHTAVNEVLWIALGHRGRTDIIPVAHPHGNIRIPRCRVPVVNWDHDHPRLDGLPRKVTTYRVQDPIMHPRRYQLPPGTIWSALRPLFFSNLRKIGHNVKFDLKTVANPNHFGELPPPPYGDTLVAAHILQVHKQFALDVLVKDIFDHEYEQLGKHIAEAEFADAASYVGQDVRYTWLLWEHLQGPLAEFSDLFDIEMHLMAVLCDIERWGVPIDLDVISTIGKRLEKDQAQVKEKLYAMRGLHEPWNIDSNAEIGRWLFSPRDEGGLGIKPKREFITPKGAYSVAAPALRAYSNKKEVTALLRHRELTKMRGTYVEGIRGWVIDGLIHPDHKLHGTVTGRLSCATPNLQNLPRVDDTDADTIAMAIRSAFVAPPGWVILVSDYDQIELRVAAGWSQDKRMIYTFLEGIDPHTMAAAIVFGISPDEVTRAQRSVGKTFNFAILYGGGHKRIASVTGMSLREAERALDGFWEGYSGFDRWKYQVIRQARRDRAVWTWMGRRRPLPDIVWGDNQKRSSAERQAVNTIIQGSAGEIMKLAMLRLHPLLDPDDARIVLTVHDELAVVCRDDVSVINPTINSMQEAMVGGPLTHFKPYPDEEDDIAIPLTAEVSVGYSWAEAKT